MDINWHETQMHGLDKNLRYLKSIGLLTSHNPSPMVPSQTRRGAMSRASSALVAAAFMQ
jgi:hypothetical protein